MEICVLPQRRAELELYEPCQRRPCKLGQYKKVPFYDRSGRPTTTTRRKGCAAKFKICASLQLLTSDNHDERAARRASKNFVLPPFWVSDDHETTRRQSPPLACEPTADRKNNVLKRRWPFEEQPSSAAFIFRSLQEQLSLAISKEQLSSAAFQEQLS